jgi:PAS domain S-box-containing protein
MTNSLQPPKILIIDDSEDNVALLRGLLEREGYKIETASDGLTGLDKVRSTDPDLILSDVMMPGLNGFQLTQRIRADKALGYIPIILVTARNDNNDKIRALETGADDFLVKPIQRLELIARTRSLIRLKRTTDHLNHTAIEKEYLYKQAEQRALELATLNETSLGIGSKISLQELLKLVLAKSCELVKAQSGIMYLVNGEEGKLQIAAIHNSDHKYLGAGIMYGEGVAGLVAITQKPMRINNYYDWSGKAPLFSNDSSITAVLGMPLLANGRTVGVLEILDDYRKHVFTDEDVRLLNLLAPQAAIALSNALLYEDVTRERDRLQALLNSVKDGILMLDRNYSVVLANQRFSELMELQSDQVTGRSISEVADLLAEVLEAEPPFSSDNMNRILRDLNRNPEKGFTRKITITDPKLRNIEWSGAPVLDINRDPIGWLNVFHDFTQQRELEQLREDFINMLVHDLKSPLTGVIGGIELADSLFSEEPQPDSEVPQQREFLQMASNNCHSMLSMVNTMLEVSRLEAGRMPLDMKLITAEDLVQASLFDLELNAREKQINLRRKLPYEPVWLKIDLSQMKRVLMNLLANAIKFSPEGSDILVTVQVEQGVRRRGTTSSLDTGRLNQSATQLLRERSDVPQKSILITVADEGPGIPPEDLGRIFNKFVQLPNSRGKIGSGLGLALCKLVIDAHGGRIWAESNYGQGSTFYISLPYTDLNSGQN